MTGNGLWRPGADPNARTQALTGVPQQAGGDDDGFAVYEEPGGRRRPNRRRVLFAAGGLMLLAGGGVAAAYASSPRGTSNTAGAGSSPSPTPTLPATTAPATSAPPSPTASATASPTASSSAPVTSPQWYVDNDGPMAIALTMDDGPDPRYTPHVLDILRQYNIKATFNMIGRQIGPNLSLVQEVSAEGHTITNHTWDHADLTHYTYNQVISEIDRCNTALADANQHPTIFRAPYGNWSKAVFQACADRDLRPVGWSVDPKDWDTAHVDTQMIVHNVLTHTRAHSIILEHDGGGTDRRNTIAALRIFIPELLDRGFNFVAM